MLIARGATAAGGELVLLGLSRNNIENLMKGRPIYISETSHGKNAIPKGMQVCIVFGETELALKDELQELIGPETEVNIDPWPREDA